MATFTELQKQGIADLIQDWPIESLIDYDTVRPIEDYSGSIPYDKESIMGFVLNPKSSLADPPRGPPLGLSRAYGTDPFIYMQDTEKFQPEWTPGATEEGRLNKEIAESIGHEARHHEFINNPELLEDLNIPAFEGMSENSVPYAHMAHEQYNLYLDAVARNELETKGFPMSREFYKLITSQRKPGEGAFGTHGLINLFDNMKTKYMKHVAPKAGPHPQAMRPKQTYVSPARPHGDGVGSMPTGTAGRNPWGRADGGLATMFERR